MHNKFNKTLSATLACLMTVGMVMNPGNGFMEAHATSDPNLPGYTDGAFTSETGNEGTGNTGNPSGTEEGANTPDGGNGGASQGGGNQSGESNTGDNSGENTPGNGENTGANTGNDTGNTENSGGETGGNTGDGTTGEGAGGEQVEPVAPELPKVSLTDKITATTKAITVNIYDIAEDTVVEYALLEDNRVLTDSAWQVLDADSLNINEQGNYDFYYRVTNGDNLTTTSEKYTIYYDSENPSMPNIDVIEYEDREYIYIEIEPSKRDTGSPIETIYYRVDGGRWREYTGRIKVTVEGEYEIEAYCIDACGNESKISTECIDVSFDVLKLPEVEMITDSPSDDYVRFRLIDDKEDFYYEYVFISSGARLGKNVDWETCGRYIEIDEEGKWDLYIRVEYDGEYITGKVATCAVDRTAPDIEDVSKKSATSSRMTIEIDAYDEISKSSIRYSFDAGKSWSYSNTKSFNTDTILKPGDIQVKDEAGNIAKSKYSYRIDISEQTLTSDIKPYYMKDNMELDHEAVNQGYMVGIGNNKFAPDKEITRAQLATILNRCINFSGGATHYNTYNDVVNTHWAYNNIVNTQKYGILKTIGSQFKPDQAVTRAELAYALCKIMDIPENNDVRCDLKDINASEFKNEIIKVYKSGLMVGYDVFTFGPNDVLTRAQVVAVINRIFDVPDSAAQYGKQFSDVPPTHWAFNEILKASH